MRLLFTIILFGSYLMYGQAQVGYGFTTSYDLYQYFANPEDATGESRSAGSALLNFGMGPKLWFGGEDFSFSVEGQASLGLLGLSASDYKGLGVASIPLLAKLNFGGLSGFDKEGKFGWSIGGGLQYNRTELYYLKNDFEEAGGERSWFKTYVGQIGYGFGMTGFSGQGYVRAGYHPDTEACNATVGIQIDLNFQKLKEIDDPASRL